MEIQLIDGVFNSNDTFELVRELIKIKIKFHENKIQTLNNIEDIKSRESKIKFLQHQLSSLINSDHIEKSQNKISATICVN
jgi:capsule polysaccharide export protein KpsE/RkpR